MDQRISVITLAADDLLAMKKFYGEILGWKSIAENKDIVFYQLNGFLLSICDRKMLAEFIGISPEGSGFRAATIGYNVDTEAEVMGWYEKLKQKGVKILKEPVEPPFGGLFFYFSDIEGNILEIACNPYVELDKNRNVVGHKPIDDL